jgi:hypothetical protein
MNTVDSEGKALVKNTLEYVIMFAVEATLGRARRLGRFFVMCLDMHTWSASPNHDIHTQGFTPSHGWVICDFHSVHALKIMFEERESKTIYIYIFIH